MTPIVCLLRNNLALNRRAIASFKKQDVPVTILAVNNASTDGTAEWLKTQKDILTMHFDEQVSVAAAWNRALKFWFYDQNAECVLVTNNDLELRPDTVRHLVADGGGFVTAVGTTDPEKIKPVDGVYPDPDPSHKRPHPDFSCFLIRREVFETVGPFEEAFRGAYCEDGDFDLRMWAKGIRGCSLDLPFLHHASQTLKNADDLEVRRIQKQADLNRRYFIKKWGFPLGSDRYYETLGKAGGPES